MSFGVCFLSWKSLKTLEKSLKAFTDVIDLSLLSDAVIYFQEIDDNDKIMAVKYGFRYEGNQNNIGIMNGMKRAVSCVKSDIVLYLECDCLLINRKNILNSLIFFSKTIQNRSVDVMRLRSLDYPGDDYTPKKHLRYWYDKDNKDHMIKKIRRLFRPHKAKRLIGESCLVHDNPEMIYPNYISNISNKYYKIYSSNINWTNQSIMFNKKWFLEAIIPFAESHPSSRKVNGFSDLEKELNCKWWRRQRFIVGWAIDGLFTHKRLDRPLNDEKINL